MAGSVVCYIPMYCVHVWPDASSLAHLLADGQLPDHLVPIGSEDMNWTMNTRGAIHHVTRFQIPLSGAEATTFHKAQGATFDKKGNSC